METAVASFISVTAIVQMLEHLAQDPDLVFVAFDGAAHALLLAFALGNINLDFLNTQGGLAKDG